MARGRTGFARFQPSRSDPLKYRIPNPKSSPKEIVGHHGHRPHGKSIYWPALYEHLRAKGMSKAKAAAISNAAWKKKKLGLPTNTPTSVRGVVKFRSGSGRRESPTVFINHKEEGVATQRIKKDDLPEEVVEYIEALEGHIEEIESDNAEMTELLEKKDEALKDLVVGQATSIVEKGDDDEVAKLLEKSDLDPALAAVIKRQREESKTLRAQVAKAESERVDLAMLAKAEALPMISTNKAELAAILRDAYAVPQEVTKDDGTKETTSLGAKVEELLKAANAQIAKGNLFTEFGKSGVETTVSASVEAQAKELMKSSPNLSYEEAQAQVWYNNPTLYDETLKGNN